MTARKKRTIAALEHLEEYVIFKGMSGEQIEAARKMICLKEYHLGDVIWQEDQPGDDVCLLLSGEVDITHRLTLLSSSSGLESHDKALIHLTAEQRPVIGEIALCANTHRSATLTATTDVQLGLLAREDLEKAAELDPQFGTALYRNLSSIVAHRLIETNINVLKLTTAFSLALEQEF